MWECAVFACLVGPSSQHSIIKSLISFSLMIGGHVESAQISKLGDAHKVRMRCLCGDVECGHPRTFSMNCVRDGQPEMLATSDVVMQYATLTDLGLCEDAPNADTAKLSFALLVILNGSVIPDSLTSVGWLSKSVSICLPGRC